MNEADDLFRNQNFNEAMTLFEKILVMDPGNPKVIAGLLRCLIQLKQFKDAREMYD